MDVSRFRGRIILFLLMGICINPIDSCTQNDFALFSPIVANYKRMLREARNQDRPLLTILYSDDVPVSSMLILEDEDHLSYVEDSTVVALIDWNKKPNHRFIQAHGVWSNPNYIIVHPEGTKLTCSQNIKNDDELKDFVRSGYVLFSELSLLLDQFNRDKKSLEAIKKLIAFYVRLSALDMAEKKIDRYIRLTKNHFSNNELRYLFSVAEKCSCSVEMENIIYENEEAIRSFATLDQIIKVKQGFILTELKAQELLTPPYVWERFEAELGVQADSMYRLFAIEYFQVVEPNRDVLLDEVYDYLYYYPNTPWEKLDPLFGLAVQNTDKKEEFEILLDLISYQVYKNPNYRNLDYRALILYKLGHEERAISMMNEIKQEALKLGINYRSMLYQLRDKKDKN